MDMWRHKQAVQAAKQAQSDYISKMQLYGNNGVDNLGCTSHCYGLADDATAATAAAAAVAPVNAGRNTLIAGGAGAVFGVIASKDNGVVGAMAGFAFAYLIAQYFYSGKWMR